MLTRFRCCSVLLLAALLVGSLASSAGAWTMTSRHSSESFQRYEEVQRSNILQRWQRTVVLFRLPSLWNPRPAVHVDRGEDKDVRWTVNCGFNHDFDWDWDFPHIKRIWEWKKDGAVPVPEPTAALVFAAGIGVASLRMRARSRVKH